VDVSGAGDHAGCAEVRELAGRAHPLDRAGLRSGGSAAICRALLRPLPLALLLTAILARLLAPVTETELAWTADAGQDRGQPLGRFAAMSWGTSRAVVELQAREPAENPNSVWRWRIVSVLPDRPRWLDHRLALEVTHPQDAAIDGQTGRPRAGDGVGLLLRAHTPSGAVTLGEWSLNAHAQEDDRRWHRLVVDVPRDATALSIEALAGPPGSNNWFDRIWVAAGPLEAALAGISLIGWPALILWGALFAALYLVVLALSLCDRALPGRTRTGAQADSWSADPPGVAGRRRALARYWPALVCLASVPVMYGPLLSSLEWGKHDDYAFLWSVQFDLKMIYMHDFERGRFLSAPLHHLLYGTVTSIGGLWFVRAVCIVALACLTGLLALLLRSRGWSGVQATAVALLFAATPSVQSTAGLGTSIHRPLAAICAVLAAIVADRAARAVSLKRCAALIAAAIGLLVAGLFFQQSWAMFYVVGAFVCRVSPRAGGPAADATRAGVFTFARGESATERRPVGTARRTVLRAAAVHSAVLALALACSFFATRAAAPLWSRTKLATDVREKARWFASEPLWNTASLFELVPSTHTVVVVCLTLLLGVTVALLARRPREAAQIAAGVALLPIAYLPSLVSAECWASYRSLGPMSALLLVLLALALAVLLRAAFTRWSAACSLLLLTSVLIAGRAAGRSVHTYIAAPQAAELALMRELTPVENTEHVREIWVIQPQWEQRPTELWRYDDFGIPSSFQEWCNGPMFRLIALESEHPSVRRLATLSIHAGFNPVAKPSPGLLQIDMRKLAELRRPRGSVARADPAGAAPAEGK
jgi:hypothetical protein